MPILKNNIASFSNSTLFCKEVLLLFLLIFSTQLLVLSQEINQFPSVEYITSNEGLSQSEVTSILQDEKGFLWIGTRGGLNRYDGNSIKIFQNELGNPNSLVNNSIECLFEQSNGNLWIGTKSNGVSVYNPKLDQFQQIDAVLPGGNKLSEARVLTIEESPTKEIWIGTWQNGLTIYNPENKTSRTIIDTGIVTDILNANDGRIWITGSMGVQIFSEKGEFIKRITRENFTAISEDKLSGNYYFGSWGRGLFEYNPTTDALNQYLNQNSTNTNSSSDNTYSLFNDNKGHLWIGTWGGGISRFNIDSKEFNNYTLVSDILQGGFELYKDVISVNQDSSGILWFGTNGGGVCRVDLRTNQFGHVKSSLPNEPIWSLNKDFEENIWVGIKGSEFLFYSNNNKNYNKIEVEPEKSSSLTSRKNGVKFIYQSRDSAIWIANNIGFYQIKTNALKPYAEKINLKFNFKINRSSAFKYTTAHQTNNGYFWIGTQQNGLLKSKQIGSPKSQIFEKYLSKERISSLLEDTSGKFWIGTYNGLKLYNSELNSFESYNKILGEANSLSSDIIICIYEDSNKNIWLGTPNGLNKLNINDADTLTFETFQVKDGLPNNYVHGIVEDDNGNLWISTNKGISRFNLNSKTFYNYDVSDGLQSNSFSEGAALKDTNGTFYFGGNYGLNIFHPDSIKDPEIPEVILTNLKISGTEINPGIKYNNKEILTKSITYSKDLTLNHDENNVAIDFTTLHFLSSSRFSYAYKLEGLEDGWRTTTTQKTVSYSNLAPGDYQFKIRAIDNNESNDAKITILNIEILPPFWKSWQAIILYLAMFMGLLFLYRYFIKQQTELKNRLELAKLNRKKEEEIAEMKTRFFTDIAHEFRTPLSLISGPVESLLGNNLSSEQKKSHLNTIQYHTKRLLNLVGQLLDFRKSESGNMKLKVANQNFTNFIEEIFLSFGELAENKKIDFKLINENSNIPLTFDNSKMEIVLCNLLSNAFKYTRNKIEIKLNNVPPEKSTKEIFPNGFLEIMVVDNGKGMSQDEIDRIFDRFYQIATLDTSSLLGTGIGLALVKNILDLHHGDIAVQSEFGKGSTFTIRIPLGDKHFRSDEFIRDFKKPEDPIHYQVERTIPKSKSVSNPNMIIDDLPKLLIVEDNSEIRSFIASIFSDSYTILEAENGEIGLNLAEEFQPLIIICDLMMPVMDGLDFTSKLRSIDKLLHIPIIMLTARTTEVFQEKGYHSGVDIYVTKPFNPSVLKAQVEGLLNSRSKLKEYFGNKINLLPTNDHKIASLDEEFLNKLMTLVENNLTNEKLSRDFLAAKMSVSPSTLYRKIKAITDLDITLFIRSIRLKRAAQMIRNKEDNISGIAYQVGFSDPKYFRKCFVKQFGVNPSQFNKQ